MNDRHDANLSRPGLRITSRTVGGVRVVEAAGEVDLVTAPALRTALLDALAESPGGLCVVDLTGVTFLDSAGLTTLIEVNQRARSLRVVVGSNRPVIRPIQLTGRDGVLALYGSVTEALAA
ncbi:STAS domain-containing protein [Actinophytocola sp.]|uniref:STAS domain-containing protein n=1 Tax=Actinophytocola sp. TaxID=1872138 RepID=UPI002D29C70A|nr:STAS domain-containing protein [Actinophytocola sp.]HYQ69482.1 STAS domain-containing protein [Actinophytocola sp.]